MTSDAWRIDAAGRLPAAHFVASPNFDERPAATPVSLVVVHAISLPPDEFGGPGIEELFTNRLDPNAHEYYRGLADLRVSAHFLVRRDGGLIQFVSCNDRAWHAGKSAWRGVEACNDFSIGIEIEGCDTLPFEEVQYHIAARLTRALLDAYPVKDVAGHADVAPGRKTDPGPFFDWRRYHGLLYSVNRPSSSSLSG